MTCGGINFYNLLCGGALLGRVSKEKLGWFWGTCIKGFSWLCAVNGCDLALISFLNCRVLADPSRIFCERFRLSLEII